MHFFLSERCKNGATLIIKAFALGTTDWVIIITQIWNQGHFSFKCLLKGFELSKYSNTNNIFPRKEIYFSRKSEISVEKYSKRNYWNFLLVKRNSNSYKNILLRLQKTHKNNLSYPKNDKTKKPKNVQKI